MQRKSGDVIEWVLPLAFIFCAGYVVSSGPNYLISWGWADVTIKDRYAGAEMLQYAALILLPFLLIAGAATVRRAPMEYEGGGGFDRISLFLGRVTMLLILLLVVVMFYEVFTRYVLSSGTLWANELSLWMAGFIFLFAGLYAMQQRSHIRIFIIYDLFPRWLQKVCDLISTLLIVVFAIAMIYGAFGEAQAKFLRWETFGTAFDPPIPATEKPMMLIVILLVAVQVVSNLIVDWNRAPEHHTVDEVDEEEIAAIKKALGETD